MNTLRLLLLDDDPGSVEQIIAALAHGIYLPTIDRIATAAELRAALTGHVYDLILASERLAMLDDMSAIEIARELSTEIPVILLCDTQCDERMIEAMGKGAADFVAKDHSARLLPAIERALRERAERLHARDELQQMKEAAEAAAHARDQFLATLSHELRTPLTPVLASINALDDLQEMPDGARALIGIIRRNIELEARLIDDLLDLTRIARRAIHLNIRPVDAHQLIDEVIESCRADSDAKGVQVTTRFAAVHPHLQADPARAQQIIWNLLKNAVKFSNRNGAITIATSNPSADRFRMELVDDGIGIAAATLPRIFDAFDQGDHVATRRSGGLGLGLAIAKSLVGLHGGTLEAASDGIGRGATFVLELPTTPVRTAAKGNGIGGGRDGEERHLRILIVDDHEDTRRVIQMLLERRGYRTLIAQSVSSALDVSASNEFDLLISDIGLPDGTGIDLLRLLNAHGATVKAIALSGYGMEEDIQRSKAAGFYEHLTKPVSIKKLQEVIDELVADV